MADQISSLKMIYTKTDEAPALATYSLFPIIQAILSVMKISIEMKDISLAGRILATFPHQPSLKSKVPDDLLALSKLVQMPTAYIIKLPNISASIPQLKATISELQKQGFDLPSYPEGSNLLGEQQEILKKYKKILGSAVNPVLREGNSDRRVPQPVKQYAQKNPSFMEKWDKDSLSHIASMTEGDFYSNEQSLTISQAMDVAVKFIDQQGHEHILKPHLSILKDEIIDTSMMSVEALQQFFEKEITQSYHQKLLLSLHLKSTMMKISDPIIFAKAIKVYFKKAIRQYESDIQRLSVNFRSGLNDLFAKIKSSPLQKEIIKAFDQCYADRPALAMVDSHKGITHLHSPHNVIIDSSIPFLIRSAGKLWGPDGKLYPTKALIPDRSYAGIYTEVIAFCKEHGTINPQTMGSVSNIGLMAQKAEEYGSHDKTFQAPYDGIIQVVDKSSQKILLKHQVKQGDIWRMCQTKDKAVRDWIQLAVKRARVTKQKTIFWLDRHRSHDRCLIERIEQYLKQQDAGQQDAKNLDIHILSPREAMRLTLETTTRGDNVISVTGNVLRDYLTDLFPILEVGTSSKMLSIVPLLKGGGLYETGAGGTAPRHVDQFLKENHLRWDSLGEFLAFAVALEDLSEKTLHKGAFILANALNKANERFLKEEKSPKRKVYQLDTRGSHFYWTLYLTEALVEELNKEIRDETAEEKQKLEEIKSQYHQVACQLKAKQKQILEEINNVQGQPVELKGYYHPDEKAVTKAMRPSATFNIIIEKLLTV